MKKIIIGIIVIVLVVGSLTGNYLLLRKSGYLGSARAFAQTQQDSKTWVVKINDTVISLQDFDREFNVHVYSLPITAEDKKKYENDINNKKKFLANLINEYLIYDKSVTEGYLKRKDVQDLIKAVTRRAVIQVYLNEKIEPLLKEVPDEQIETIYNQNKKLFAGVDIDVARQQIRMQLLQKQYNDQLNEIIDNLKGEAKVIKNEKVGL